ncbi:MAG: DUF4397 domain-containing protein [Bacillaceae bacterium]
MKKRIFLAILACFMTVLVMRVNASPTNPNASQIRFIHASPNAPTVDVVLDGQKIATGVKFKDVTELINVSPGKHKVEIMPSGATGDKKLTKELNILPGRSFNVVATNDVSNLELTILLNEPCKADGKAHIRVGNLSPDAPNVDTFIKNKNLVIKNIPYRNVSKSVAIDPGIASVEVRPVGTENVVVNIPSMDVKANSSYTLLIVGMAKGTSPLTVIVLDEMCK